MTTTNHAHPAAGIVHVGDLDDPRVAIFRELRDQWRRARHRAWMESGQTAAPANPDTTGTGLDPALDPDADLFIAEGTTVVEQLLTSPHDLVSAMVSDQRLDVHAALIERIAARAPVYVVPRKSIASLAGFDIHRGVLALGRRRDQGDAEALLAQSACCVILEDLANHDNVGGIFRSVRALCPPVAGYAHPACVLLSPRCCDPLYRKALRVSMGNALHVPWATLGPWPEALSTVAGAGFDLLAMHPAGDAVDIRGVASSRPALIMGTEGPGLQPGTLDTIRRSGGRAVRIPIERAADSLNVGVAAAVALHRVCSWDDRR